jgi:hypothetical protein
MGSRDADGWLPPGTNDRRRLADKRKFYGWVVNQTSPSRVIQEVTLEPTRRIPALRTPERTTVRTSAPADWRPLVTERVALMTGMTEDEELYNYQYGVAPYDTLEGRAAAPQWLKDRTQGAVAPRPVPEPETFPAAPVPGAVAKNAVLYAVLGLVIPGLPSLLIRDDKVVGGIQLGIWVLSWILTIVFIGFLLWPVAAIWSAVTGYGDAQLWNRRHGFLT